MTRHATPRRAACESRRCDRFFAGRESRSPNSPPRLHPQIDLNVNEGVRSLGGAYAFTPLGARGSDRKRTPVAAKMALPLAGAIPMIGVSPAPADGRSVRLSNTTSSFGA